MSSVMRYVLFRIVHYGLKLCAYTEAKSIKKKKNLHKSSYVKLDAC